MVSDVLTQMPPVIRGGFIVQESLPQWTIFLQPGSEVGGSNQLGNPFVSFGAAVHTCALGTRRKCLSNVVAKFRAGLKLSKIHEFMIVGLISFRICVLPDGLAKELTKMLKIPEYLESTDCAMRSTISTYKIDATKTPDEFNKSPTYLEGVGAGK